jgi:hypothetical protein
MSNGITGNPLTRAATYATATDPPASQVHDIVVDEPVARSVLPPPVSARAMLNRAVCPPPTVNVAVALTPIASTTKSLVLVVTTIEELVALADAAVAALLSTLLWST